jgi:nitrate/nitrite-specific signal transduction histidine kinase
VIRPPPVTFIIIIIIVIIIFFFLIIIIVIIIVITTVTITAGRADGTSITNCGNLRFRAWCLRPKIEAMVEGRIEWWREGL